MSIKSDLLRRERRPSSSGLTLTEQPSSLNRMLSLGGGPSSMLDQLGLSEIWSGQLANDSLWGSFDLMSDIDISASDTATGDMNFSL